MSSRVRKMSDEEVWDHCFHLWARVPESAQPRTEAVVRQIINLGIKKTNPANPKHALTAQEIRYHCDGVRTMDNGREYMHRIGGNRDGWMQMPGFALRRNHRAYRWPHGRLELLFDRLAFVKGIELSEEYSLRFDGMEMV